MRLEAGSALRRRLRKEGVHRPREWQVWGCEDLAPPSFAKCARTGRTDGVHRDSDPFVLTHQRHGCVLKAEGIKLSRQEADAAAIVDRGAAETKAGPH